MSGSAKETTNQQIIKENLKKPESERLSMESLKMMGVISRLDVIIFHKGKEWVCTEYYDPERITLAEVLKKVPRSFEKVL